MQLLTENGYILLEAVSALQKTIRRGIEEEAMFWATEIETKYHDYLWRRLQIISIEDIGIAAPEVVLYVAELRRLYSELRLEYRKKGRGLSFRMALANAILAMCRAPKCRIGDEFQIVIYGRRAEGWKLDIPDFALDMHTGRGKMKGRGQNHFWRESVKLVNQGKVLSPYYNEAVKFRVSKDEEDEPDQHSDPSEDKKLF